MSSELTYAYSVDRTDNGRLRRYGALPESMQTAWHRARPDDEALAACSKRILLNVEDRTPATDVSGRLCRLCFPSPPEPRPRGPEMTTVAEPVTKPQVTTPATDCVFCERIARHEYDTCWNEVVSFEPLDPAVPRHRLFVPVTHVSSALTWPQLTGAVFAEAARWASEVGVDCNLITSAGAAATQTVWHLHVHYIPRTRDDGLALPWTGASADALDEDRQATSR